ncbi:hypothetical protein Ga0100231_017870 [Opitutaceae bacterium TAV4]|nr:hypothetical protein Ga0100231_017870 [Opitutaceae bacterium TAV4]RRK00005.1 hypothetical protein Ga0100230_018555 [Opitutaceae bacterium TAV3]
MKITSLQPLQLLRCALSLAAIALIAHIDVAHADVVISAAKPSESQNVLAPGILGLTKAYEVDASANGAVLSRNSAGTTDRFGGSTFKLGNAVDVSGVTFAIRFIGNAADSIVDYSNKGVRISIVTFGDGGISFPYESTEYFEDFNMPADFKNSEIAGKYITFNFSETRRLVAGSYGLVFQWLEGASDGIRFHNVTSGTVSDTSVAFRIEKSTTTTVTTNGTEYFYLVHGTVAVPEPTTYAVLLGLAMLTSVVAYRIRRYSSKRG